MKNIKSPYKKEIYERNSVIYRILSNAKRLEILNTLKGRELTVNTISNALGIRLSNVSQHLSLLRSHKLVRTKRQGQSIVYSLTDQRRGRFFRP